jgi:hypothetical protein
MIDKLIANDILAVAGNRLVPAQPFDRLTMKKLIETIRLPVQSLPAALASQPDVIAVTDKISDSIDDAVGVTTVSTWIRGETS